MKSKTIPPMVRCAYRSRRTGQCIKTFPARGPKQYCRPGHRVRASHERNRRHLKTDAFRHSVIERDGGCVRKRPSQDDWDNGGDCAGKLFVRIVDPKRGRTLENVETLCARHFGMKSNEQFRDRVGPEVHRAKKRVQGSNYLTMKLLRLKMSRIYHRDKKNPIDYL